MIFIASIFFTMIIFVHLHPSLNDEFTRRDCYESFTFPKVFIELSNFAPIGPAYLFIIFHFYLYPVSNVDQEIILVEKYYFKRMSRPCTSSLIFTTRGILFTKMLIGIEIYLYHRQDIIADIFYTFEYGFIPGVYQLCDKNRYFGILMEILKNGNEHIMNVTNYPKVAKYYLRSFKMNNENNRYVIIKPIYNNGTPNGLITNIVIENIRHYNLIGSFRYSAFECPSDEIDIESSIIIVEDQSQTDEILFFASYMKYDKGYIVEKEIIFSLLNISRTHVRDLVDLPGDYKKLYIIQDRRKKIICQDDTRRILYYNDDGIPFYAIEVKNDEVASNVFQRRWIVHSPSAPCTT